MNGKLGLTEAEAVMSLISAKGEQEARAALAVHGGALEKRIRALRQRLLDTVAHLEAWADYPEDEIPEVTGEGLMETLAALAGEMKDLLAGFDEGKLLRDGVDTVIGTKGVFLSGGEQQRIAIARVMLKNAPILILDEATAFADPDNEAKVQAAFSRLSAGKTVIMIAHRLSTVADVDCIYVIDDGKVAESGTGRELLDRGGLFAQMWNDYQTSVQWRVSKEA